MLAHAIVDRLPLFGKVIWFAAPGIILSVVFSPVGRTGWAQEIEQPASAVDAAANNLDVASFVGKTIDVQYQDAMNDGPFEVVKANEGKTPGTLRSLRVKIPGEKRNQTITAKKVSELFIDRQPLDVIYDRKERALVFSPQKKLDRLAKEKQVVERLRQSGNRLWEPLSAKQQAVFLADQRKFLTEAQKKLPHVGLRLIETEFFMVFTDIAPDLSAVYVDNLDAMYRELCNAFGLSPRRNIWCGKCVVVIFNNKVDYMTYESKVMGVKDVAFLNGTAGLCHSFGNGEVKFAGYRGTNAKYFGDVLIHETTHGFVHRYVSSSRVPSWLNEGIAEWVTNAIMQNGLVPKKQKRSAQMIMATGSWGDFLIAQNISFEHYGAAVTMVDILLTQNDDGQFRRMIRDIKEGKPTEASLKEHFKVSFADLEKLYADWITR